MTAKPRTLSDEMYQEAKDLFMAGNESAAHIARKYNVGAEYFRNRMRKDGIDVQAISVSKPASSRKATKPINKPPLPNYVDDKIPPAPKEDKRENETSSEYEERMNSSFSSNVEKLAGLTLMELARAKKGNMPIGMVKDDVKTLNMAMDVVTKGYKMLKEIHGFGKNIAEAELPTFTVYDMGPEGEAEMRKKTNESYNAMRGEIPEIKGNDVVEEQ